MEWPESDRRVVDHTTHSHTTSHIADQCGPPRLPPAAPCARIPPPPTCSLPAPEKTLDFKSQLGWAGTTKLWEAARPSAPPRRPLQPPMHRTRGGGDTWGSTASGGVSFGDLTGRSGHSLGSPGSPPPAPRLPNGADTEGEVARLQKQNFNLKLRVYYLEEVLVQWGIMPWRWGGWGQRETGG
jgi:hypothetical protein